MQEDAHLEFLGREDAVHDRCIPNTRSQLDSERGEKGEGQEEGRKGRVKSAGIPFRIVGRAKPGYEHADVCNNSYDVGAMSQLGQPGHTCNALTARANQGSRKCTEPAQRYDKDTRTYAIRELSHLR